jgi:uncharacterized membrane protein
VLGQREYGHPKSQQTAASEGEMERCERDGSIRERRRSLLEIPVEDLFKQIAEVIAVGVECSAALIISYGAVEALVGSVRAVAEKRSKSGLRKDTWMRFGVWLLLGLEFELAADIVRTAIAPTWTDIGQLAAIGVIRTFLNHFLEKDLEKYEPHEVPAARVEAAQAAA